MIDTQKIGERIKSCREQTNMTQESLAQKLNVSRQSVSKWEKGNSLPDIDRLVDISSLFDISLDELITGKEPYTQKVVVKNVPQKHMNGYEFWAKYWWTLILLGFFIVIPVLAIISTFLTSFFND